MRTQLRSRWPAFFAVLFALEWLLLAWHPRFPRDWALENLLSLGSAWWLLRRHRRRPLSDLAYALLFLFGSAHELGAHYTYAEVPYEAWGRDLLGISIDQLFGFSRNQYDRLLHFCFGLLCFLPMREALHPYLPRGAAAPWVLTGAVMTAISALYELLEWAAAELFGGELGQVFLGAQGDVWDAQKDMALALLGCVIAGSALAARANADRPLRNLRGPGDRAPAQEALRCHRPG